MKPPLHVAVVGGGWAGIAAAVEALHLGHRVTVLEMAARLGGRARTVDVRGHQLDNGQHIMIGAYRDTLALMRRVGAEPDKLLLRRPLALAYPDGSGLQLPAGAPMVAFARGALAARGWSARTRLALLVAATGWLLKRFRCDPGWSVERLTRSLPDELRRDVIDPLCVAALNTDSSRASAAVFLRVLKDALFSGPGCADLLLPKVTLGRLLPDPAAAWMASRQAEVRTGCRVDTLERGEADGWLVNGERFDAVVLACSAPEAARLAARHAPGWAAAAGAIPHEPIVTVFVDAPQARLPLPMLALRSEPAQFVFDHGALGGHAGRLAFVVSGARRWLEDGVEKCADAVQKQATAMLQELRLPAGVTVIEAWAEKRATFACEPNLPRPPSRIAERLVAAADYVAGPYPATLEGAVRAGLAAARDLA